MLSGFGRGQNFDFRNIYEASKHDRRMVLDCVFARGFAEGRGRVRRHPFRSCREGPGRLPVLEGSATVANAMCEMPCLRHIVRRHPGSKHPALAQTSDNSTGATELSPSGQPFGNNPLSPFLPLRFRGSSDISELGHGWLFGRHPGGRFGIRLPEGRHRGDPPCALSDLIPLALARPALPCHQVELALVRVSRREQPLAGARGRPAEVWGGSRASLWHRLLRTQRAA